MGLVVSFEKELTSRSIPVCYKNKNAVFKRANCVPYSGLNSIRRAVDVGLIYRVAALSISLTSFLIEPKRTLHFSQQLGYRQPAGTQKSVNADQRLVAYINDKQ